MLDTALDRSYITYQQGSDSCKTGFHLYGINKGGDKYSYQIADERNQMNTMVSFLSEKNMIYLTYTTIKRKNEYKRKSIDIAGMICGRRGSSIKQ